MASLNSSCFMVKTFVGFFITIAFGVVLCKAKQDKPFKTQCENEKTPYPTTSNHTLSTPLLDSENGNDFLLDFLLLYNLSMQVSINEVSRVSKDFGENGTLTQTIKDIDTSLQSAIESCQLLLSLALYNLNLSSTPTNTSVIPTHETRVDFRIWLSATVADLETCLDGFEYAPDEARKIVLESLDSSNKLVSNSLSIITKIDNLDLGSSIIGGVGSRKLGINEWPPSWLSFKDRKLLYGSKQTMIPNVVVAKDGSGNYTTINEAIKIVPQMSTSKFVIYVKEGIYYENVEIDMTKWNIMMFGDGMNKTIVSGKLSNSSGVPTVMSATFAVHGDRFIALDMGFQNTAGPTMNQAVALLSTSDKSIIYRCSIDAYQDTLFTLSNRQFYRECQIYGTIDFIFGHSTTVIQNSTILVKKPLHGQANTITAQGKSKPDAISGISIQNCIVIAAEDLAGAATFLGRPWGNLSTTIFMETFLDSLIDPLGWLPWKPNVTPPDTIYYAEYMNYGPGSGTAYRVPWKGVSVNITVEEAKNFTVREFIGGVEWIPETGVPFQPDL